MGRFTTRPGQIYPFTVQFTVVVKTVPRESRGKNRPCSRENRHKSPSSIYSLQPSFEYLWKLKFSRCLSTVLFQTNKRREYFYVSLFICASRFRVKLFVLPGPKTIPPEYDRRLPSIVDDSRTYTRSAYNV